MVHYITSPSGKYRLKIEIGVSYLDPILKTSQFGSRISVEDIVEMKSKCQFIIEGSVFRPIFFNRKNQEWVYGEKAWNEPCFIELDSGKIYSNTLDSIYGFSWDHVVMNSSGTLAAVIGGEGGQSPYELRVFDFNVEPDIKPVPIKDYDCRLPITIWEGQEEIKWVDEVTLNFKLYLRWSKIFYKPEKYLTPQEQKESEEYYQKFPEENDKNLIYAYGFTLRYENQELVYQDKEMGSLYAGFLKINNLPLIYE